MILVRRLLTAALLKGSMPMCSLCLPRSQKPKRTEPARTSADDYVRLLRERYQEVAAREAPMRPGMNGELHEIREAMERIYLGRFGRCEECEEMIPRERLARIPHARFCVECQSEHESKFAKRGPRRAHPH
jgi:RNA polymerase-binding transcription factor DksA